MDVVKNRCGHSGGLRALKLAVSQRINGIN